MTVQKTYRHWSVLAGVLLICCAFSGCSNSPNTNGDDTGIRVLVADAWVYAIDGDKTQDTNLFFVMRNNGSQAVTLTGGESSVAKSVEIFTSSSGSTTMTPAPDGITIAAGGTHDFGPDGDYVMLMGVTKKLNPGDQVTVTLKFSDGESLVVPAEVKESAENND